MSRPSGNTGRETSSFLNCWLSIILCSPAASARRVLWVTMRR